MREHESQIQRHLLALRHVVPHVHDVLHTGRQAQAAQALASDPVVALELVALEQVLLC